MKKRTLVCVALATTLFSCTRPPPGASSAASGPAAPQQPTLAVAAGAAAGATPAAAAPPAPVAPAAPAASLLGTPDDDHQVGAANVWENLAIFPVTSKLQTDVGPITTLEDALAKKTASVHEVGAGNDGAGAAQARNGINAQAQAFRGGAQVNTLVIENKGTIPIYVLAGTLVKGGQQDRQIGQDFIVGANQTVPVDAYCVEHGRWTTNRDGVATAGQFGVSGLLTSSDVRSAGQYQHDQSQVWSKVASVNSANRKASASGTLFATMDAGDVAAHRKALATNAEAFLKAVQPGEDVVGYAYAIDGHVRGVRWFASHKVFDLFRGTLLATAAMDAINAQAARPPGGPPAPSPVVAQTEVSRFVRDLQQAKVKEEQTTPALNVNVVRESPRGYSASTRLKAAPAAASPVSSDFTSK